MLNKKALFIAAVLCIAAISAVHAAPRARVENTLKIQNIKNAKEKEALCLDGSVPAYYVDTVEDSRDWIVVLEGGAFCSSQSDCKERSMGYLGSSEPEILKTENVDQERPGLYYLSADEVVNPTFHKFNKAFLHYCSGDVYTGNNTLWGLEFRGHNMVYALFDDLKSEWGLGSGANLVFAGESAGGVGVIANIDDLSDALKNDGITVVGVDNSGFFNGFPFIYEVAMGITSEWFAIFGYTVRDLMLNVYNSVLNKECLDYYGYALAHGCISGQHSYPFIKTPMFTMTARFDAFYVDQALDIPWIVQSMTNGTVNFTSMEPQYLSAFGNFSAMWMYGMTDNFVNTTLSGTRCENFCSSRGENLIYNEKCEQTDGVECVDKVCQKCEGDNCPDCAKKPYNSNGVFFPSCSLHVFTEEHNGITVNGINSITALGNWYTKQTTNASPATYQLVTTIGGQAESQGQCCDERLYPFTISCSNKAE
eukprot:Nk52_evm103s151 gene=Nk52_evmTU103s151